uniref:AAA domain-containing protein n=1 Tax=Candidatus Kentrum sp. LFY TaxID=2126342 RepID=A0A450VEE0_9GAMM|nr:MAG: AAA domain-containing protein [Candidatus Kentron sp. LFY]
MYKRELAQRIIKNLRQNPAVAILGPRQIGKTTLAHEIAKRYASIYLDLENPEDFQKLKYPVHYLELHGDKLVILDEVQRYPALFMSLRGKNPHGRGEGVGLFSVFVFGRQSYRFSILSTFFI